MSRGGKPPARAFTLRLLPAELEESFPCAAGVSAEDRNGDDCEEE
jgi:hypothetical protein